jgi:hypothetical protein
MLVAVRETYFRHQLHSQGPAYLLWILPKVGRGSRQSIPPMPNLGFSICLYHIIVKRTMWGA